MPQQRHFDRLQPHLPHRLPFLDEAQHWGKDLCVCHIGMPVGLHLKNLMRDIALTGVRQCCIGCVEPAKAILPEDIPYYYFPYDKITLEDGPTMALQHFLKKVFALEKPQLLHGHDFKGTSLIAVIAKAMTGMPLMMFPWGLEKLLGKDHVALHYEQQCLKQTDMLVFSQPLVNEFLACLHRVPPPHYRRCLCCSMDMEPFITKHDYTAPPAILAGRMLRSSCHQEQLALALPYILDRHPEAHVTFMYGLDDSPEARHVLDQIKITLEMHHCLDRCRFLTGFVGLDVFAEEVRNHNVAFTVSSGDMGLSNTNIYTCVSGALTLVGDTPLLDGVLDQHVHALRHGVQVPQILFALREACDNLATLGPRMAEANQDKLFFDRQIQIPLLIRLYRELLGQ